MARIIVTTDDDRRRVLMDERHVAPVHIDSEHSAVQLLERLAWAIREADRHPERPARRRRRRRRPPGGAPSHA